MYETPRRILGKGEGENDSLYRKQKADTLIRQGGSHPLITQLAAFPCLLARPLQRWYNTPRSTPSDDLQTSPLSSLDSFPHAH